MVYLPLCAWGSNAFKKVASLFGKFKFFDSEVNDYMSMGRVCIATKKQSFIDETMNVVIHGETFKVHVKEIRTWGIHITNDLVSNDDEKELLNVPKGVQHMEKGRECSKIDSEGSTPLRFDKFLEVNKEGNSFSMESVKDEYVVKQIEVENKDVDSDATIPPGFENLFNRKYMKGFSFVDEMNRLIEVGGALGYDVKVCKCSLRRMINGMGVSMVDK
nr:hypothetical protein [Tanacetum cinerariifolium]